ncbi:DNA-binding transcriptional regulator, GntR family [Saccharopolyspora antimicrobica]|uniref:DNA-binding transcriptional regulator, GntR family n=1 Tax=Saccharopolyspora antimicrobica TaxID=455193 RepID=A0A1I4RTK8_9PSEU|nr:GntR family transcriptional regulator [Saccharopolyspora antimicrobica]RKT87890.1 GntR family transcriptional regulator [Saccharopolyspora antimicrobica]SFM55343.1 DNA-binding transcriptional regulator, GntR family [Saccharopolyspora antimicrobica]
MSLTSKPPQGLAARQVARPVPLRDTVYEAILELIVTGELKPGQHLVEKELAELLGVSRQPVREALQWLKKDEWVDLRPGYGAFVHSPTPEEADQLLGVRTLLEAESARLAALNSTKEGIAELKQIYRRGVQALKADDVEAVVAANAELHARITEMSGNKVLGELAAQINRRVRWYHTPVAKSRGKKSWDEHSALIDAIAKKDAERAAQLMREHTEHTRESYLAQNSES